ncbi:MAG: hypothetical protein BWK73_04620 [Thiothrix lacustris]|uniref:Uncharacterized protein n=1 Tax=Thiothrix lacustris TaxID=525917 RepID=A0A1Y1QY74_9GAMM|nr:MAG: hypothetical protein BWK73_04620 [Thiothrix lacustris]
MTQKFFNNLRTSLIAPLQPGANTLPIAADSVPLGNGDWCYLTLQATINGSTVVEIVKATLVDAVVTIERGQQDTVSNALAFPAGTLVENRITAGDMQALQFTTIAVAPLM